ncbi:MAG: ABC transporter substrate-binding protein [Rhodospirillales bacterium]|nr:ABC transporter substrate-binding protein [Rhodospirillales bacterium]
MRAFHHYFYAILLLVSLLLPLPAWADTAGEHVAQFQAGLISVMKDAEKLGVKGRYEQLEPLIKKTFHLNLMAGLSAGQYWNQADSNQQNRLVEAFTKMSTATLATLFNGYSGEQFTIVGERPGPQGITFVDTSLKVPGRDKNVSISYVARKFEGDWLLIDVIVDGGISELKVRMSEYRQTLNKGGMEALIDLLNNKAKSLLI